MSPSNDRCWWISRGSRVERKGEEKSSMDDLKERARIEAKAGEKN